jgi:hypothetical protein
MNNSGLLTPFIDSEGAKSIMVAAGIMPDKIPIAEFSVANHGRERYLFGLLFAVAYSVAEVSANPAALVEADEHGYSYADPILDDWAKRSAAELEQLLSGL